MLETLNKSSATLDHELGRVLEVFDAELRSDLPFIQQLVEHIRGYRGKLLRPRLVLLSAAAVDRVRSEHFTLAAVVEMIHMATLVHDDVLDEADVRRQTATINRFAGNESAVMLGDFLISHAYHLCSTLDSQRIAGGSISRRIAAVTNTVCEGELMQIHHRGEFDLSEPEYLEIIRRKTASLTGVCCELGAAACEARDDIVERMVAFGTNLGMAFQIVDDLLDLTGTTRQLGKSAGRDADLGKLTLPAIRFLQQAGARERDQFIAAMGEAENTRRQPLKDLLGCSDALDYALNRAREYIDSAISQLSPLADSDAKESLITAAQFVISRTN